MLTVRRANVILRVSDEQKLEYINKGFDVINEDGTVIEHTIPSDVNVLKRAYTDHIKEIETLKAALEDNGSSDMIPQEDFDKLLDAYNEAQDEIDELKTKLAEYEEAEEVRPTKRKTTKK